MKSGELKIIFHPCFNRNWEVLLCLFFIQFEGSLWIMQITKTSPRFLHFEQQMDQPNMFDNLKSIGYPDINSEMYPFSANHNI